MILIYSTHECYVMMRQIEGTLYSFLSISRLSLHPVFVGLTADNLRKKEKGNITIKKISNLFSLYALCFRFIF